jgi:hypothetical protein
MDRSAVEAVVRRELQPLCDRMGLGHWKIKVTFDLRKEVGNRRIPGECHRLYDYEKVSIELDPDWFDDEAEVLQVLRHELLHLVASPFDLFAESVEKLAIDEATKDVLNRVWNHAQEMTVVNLERLWSNLSDTPPGPATEPTIDTADGPPAIS